jgi:hyperosmotically inducible periplasmic protein
MSKLFLSSLLVLGSAGWVAAQEPPAAPPPQQSTPSGMSDSQVTSKVRQALMNDNTTQPVASNVKVSTKNGMVTLKGKVDNEADKDAVIAKARSIAGDTNVKDEISVAK